MPAIQGPAGGNLPADFHGFRPKNLTVTASQRSAAYCGSRGQAAVGVNPCKEFRRELLLIVHQHGESRFHTIRPFDIQNKYDERILQLRDLIGWPPFVHGSNTKRPPAQFHCQEYSPSPFAAPVRRRFTSQGSANAPLASADPVRA